MLLALPQSLPTESRWSTARTRADVTALLRALRSHLSDMPQTPAINLLHPLTGTRYPHGGVPRGARGPAQTLQADLDRAIAAPGQNLITLRIQAALVGFFPGLAGTGCPERLSHPQLDKLHSDGAPTRPQAPLHIRLHSVL